MPFNAISGEHDLAPVLTLEVLFRAEVDFVMNIARRYGLSDADAEDVTQQVFIALQRRLHTLSSPESVRPWLMVVTRRRALARRAENLRRPAEPAGEDIGEIVDDVPLAEEQLLRTEKRRELLDFLESIEPCRRIVLAMYVLDELPMAEIADALGIPIATAYNRLRLARQDLQDALARKDVAEEHGLLLRAWQSALKVRDPFESFYGRAAITPLARERIWSAALDALRAAHGSLEAAELTGLRVLSPFWKKDCAPRPYRLPRRRPKFARSERVAIGSRTP